MSDKKIIKSVDGQSFIVSKEILEQQALELPSSALRKLKEKKPRSEAQIAASQRLAEFAREKRRLAIEAKARLLEEHKEELPVIKAVDSKIVEEIIKPAMKAKKTEEKKTVEEKLLSSGSHIRVVVRPRRPRKKKVETTEDSSDITTDITETEDDTDAEEYKSKARQVRRAQVAKKLVKTVEKIDRVIQQTPQVQVQANPYASMLAGRWR